MSKPNETNPKRALILAAVAVIAVGSVVTFALLQTPPPAPPADLIAAATPSPAPAQTQSTQPLVSSQTSRDAETVTVPKASKNDEPIPVWETQIDNVLRSNVGEAQTAQILLNMLPTLPEDGQVEAANHIANLLPDANYNQVKPVLLNPNTSEDVLSVFFTDLMNRDDQTKLRTFLDIAKVPNHPFHEEALSDLEIYVGDDYGTDWTKWNAAVEKYLRTADAADQ
jgi:hypothetical protein